MPCVIMKARYCHDHPEFPSRHFASAFDTRGPLQGPRLLARSELSLRWTDLSVCQSPAARTTQTRTRQATSPWTLGDNSRAEFHLCTYESRNQEIRRGRDLYLWARTWRPGHGGQRLFGGHLYRGRPKYSPERGWFASSVPAVLVSRRHSQSRRARDAWFHPRGR